MLNTLLRVSGKTDPKAIFRDMDADKDRTIDIDEFTTYFLKLKARYATSNGGESKKESNLERAITRESLKDLFNALDRDGSKSLDI